MPKILVVCGPTASGKSQLALDLAKKFHGEIVTADSRQMYQGMVIGTNSPTASELQEAPHHLSNFLSPEKHCNVAEYKKLAEQTIDNIIARKKVPILVGGTGLYIQAIVDNFDFAHTKPNPELRESLEKKNLDELLQQIDALPKVRLAITDHKNKRRVVRALEVALGNQSTTTKRQPKYAALQLAPDIDREKLYEKINARVLQMIQDGLEKEVRELVKTYSWDIDALSGIGYREFRSYLEGEASLDSIVSEIQKDTRRYAKRQLTWFKADARIHWVQDFDKASTLVKEFLQ